MDPNQPQFWMMVSLIVIAICFVVMGISLLAIGLTVRKVTASIKRLETHFVPLVDKMNAITIQGREMSIHFNEVAANLSTATKYLAESTELIKEEVADLREMVGSTALVARDKVEMVSRTIDRTNQQVTSTTDFVQEKIVLPAREIAAIMAGVKKGLEVLFAPAPKQLDQAYMEDEMFIG